jgi:hypothetical protein
MSVLVSRTQIYYEKRKELETFRERVTFPSRVIGRLIFPRYILGHCAVAGFATKLDVNQLNMNSHIGLWHYTYILDH